MILKEKKIKETNLLAKCFEIDLKEQYRSYQEKKIEQTKLIASDMFDLNEFITKN